MCLDRTVDITDAVMSHLTVVEHEGEKWYEGWKVFVTVDGDLRSPYRGTQIYTLGERIVNNQTVKVATRSRLSTYTSGYHCFTNVEDATEYGDKITHVKRVLFKDITAVGYDAGLLTVVAQEMIICV